MTENLLTSLLDPVVDDGLVAGDQEHASSVIENAFGGYDCTLRGAVADRPLRDPAHRPDRPAGVTAATSITDPRMSYWPTPADVADDLMYFVLESWHRLGDGLRVLEPSAGEGHLVRAIRSRLPEAHITAVEPDPVRAARLRDQPAGADEVIQSTLEDYTAAAAAAYAAGGWQPFDLAIANPPFTLPDRPQAWAEHLLAMYHDPHLLAPGAVIAAVVPHIALTGTSRLVRAVRALTPSGAEACERGAFATVGARVSTALMWAQKPFN